MYIFSTPHVAKLSLSYIVSFFLNFRRNNKKKLFYITQFARALAINNFEQFDLNFVLFSNFSDDNEIR